MKWGTLALALLAVTVGPALAADESRVTVRPSPAATTGAIQATLDSLLENYDEGTVTASGMIVATPPSNNVLIARVSSEGTIETSCVVTRSAARSILARIRAESQHVAQEK